MSLSVVDSSLVVVLDLRPSARVAAAWDGRSPFVTLHAVAGGGFGMAVESLPVWSDALDRPVIEPTLESLERFVLERLADDDVELLADLVEDVSSWSEERDVEPVSVAVS